MRAPFDISGLGLPRVQAALLAGIAEQGVSTAVHLSGRLGICAETVSRALTALCDAGLVTRGEGRPRPLTLDPSWHDHALLLREELVRAQRAQRTRFDTALARLARTAEATTLPAAVDRGLVPTRAVPSNPNRDLYPMTRSWCEITSGAAAVLQMPAWLRRARRCGVAVRLLVTEPAPAKAALTNAATIGAEVRLTSERLSPLLIVDGSRARVLVSVSGSARHGWTTDQGQLRLLLDGFDAAWTRAAS